MDSLSWSRLHVWIHLELQVDSGTQIEGQTKQNDLIKLISVRECMTQRLIKEDINEYK